MKPNVIRGGYMQSVKVTLVCERLMESMRDSCIEHMAIGSF